MTILDDIALDLPAIEEGRWVTIHGLRIKLRGRRCEAYQERLEELFEPHRAIFAAAPNSEASRKLHREAVRRAVLERCVADWEAHSRDGAAIPCTPETVYELLSQPKFAHVYESILGHVAADNDYLTRAEVAEAGNFVAGSGGT